VSGSFTFTAGAPDVVKYVYGWRGLAKTTVTVPAGASYTVTLTPPMFGRNTLEVYSLDSVNKQSVTHNYGFLVGAPSQPLAHWPLDTIDGHNYSDVRGGKDLTANESVSWAYDTRIVGEATASFANGGDAQTTGPVVDTSKSFSVSAWVRLTDTSDSYRAVISQVGAVGHGFILYNTRDAGLWGFVLYNTDSTSTAGTFVYAPATLNVWTHLLAVYDAGERQVKIYANGVLTQAATRTATPWNATGPLHLGWARGMSTGVGQITDVRVWQRVVVPQDIWGADADAAAGVEAVAGLLTPTKVAAWDFNGAAGHVCASALSPQWGQSLDFGEGTCTDPYSPAQTAGYTADDHDGNGGAMWLNHSPDGEAGTAGDGQGYAATAGPVLVSDQSFTVSAWVRPTIAGGRQVVLSQVGANQARFLLCQDQDGSVSKWRFYLYGADNAAATGAGVFSTDPVAFDPDGDGKNWTHIVGVYDAALSQIRLYVNGTLQGAPVDVDAVPAWRASGPLNVGRSVVAGAGTSHFRGDVDQVSVFAGAMSDREVRNLFESS
jgi:hypothetical protein